MDVLIYGAGLLGRQIHYLIDIYFKDRFKILGFIDDAREKGLSVVNDLHILGSLKEIYEDGNYSPDKVKLVLAIGYSDMQARRNAYNNAKELGYEFEGIIHPEAVVEKNAEIGEGVIILAGVVVDQYVAVRDINYLDIGTMMGENTIIETNNYFSAGTTVGGSVRIGENNFFGLNSTVVNDVSVGSNNFINAKALIYKNLGDNKKVIEFYEQRIIGR